MSTDTNSLFVTIRRGDGYSSLYGTYAEYFGDPLMSDISINVNNSDSVTKFYCQKVILAKQCTELHRRLTDPRQGFRGCSQFNLNGSSPTQVKRVLDFIYSGEVTLPLDEIEGLLEEAVKLGATALVEEINRYLKEREGEAYKALNLVDIKFEEEEEDRPEVEVIVVAEENQDEEEEDMATPLGNSAYFPEFPPNTNIHYWPSMVTKSPPQTSRHSLDSAFTITPVTSPSSTLSPRQPYQGALARQPRKKQAKLGVTYSMDDVNRAVNSIETNGKSMYNASKVFGVPRMAIKRRMEFLKIKYIPHYNAAGRLMDHSKPRDLEARFYPQPSQSQQLPDLPQLIRPSQVTQLNQFPQPPQVFHLPQLAQPSGQDPKPSQFFNALLPLQRILKTSQATNVATKTPASHTPKRIPITRLEETALNYQTRISCCPVVIPALQEASLVQVFRQPDGNIIKVTRLPGPQQYQPPSL